MFHVWNLPASLLYTYMCLPVHKIWGSVEVNGRVKALLINALVLEGVKAVIMNDTSKPWFMETKTATPLSFAFSSLNYTMNLIIQ